MIRLIACIAAAVSLCGCVSVKNDRAIVPPPALISVVKAPLTVPSEPVSCENLKTGMASEAFYIWEYLFTGISATVWTATLEEARRAGGLKNVKYADYEMTSILGYITVFSVRAYGE